MKYIALALTLATLTANAVEPIKIHSFISPKTCLERSQGARLAMSLRQNKLYKASDMYKEIRTKTSPVFQQIWARAYTYPRQSGDAIIAQYEDLTFLECHGFNTGDLNEEK